MSEDLADAMTELANDLAGMALAIATSKGCKPTIMLGAMALATTALTVQHSKPGMAEDAVKGMIGLINSSYPSMIEGLSEIGSTIDAIDEAFEARKKGAIQ